MHVTVSHTEEGSRVNSPAAVWVESVSARGFEACVREAGIGTNGSESSTGWRYKIIPK